MAGIEWNGVENFQHVTVGRTAVLSLNLVLSVVSKSYKAFFV